MGDSLRAMVKSENSPDRLTIDGDDYFWKVRHGWLVDSGVGIKGISISVWRRPGSTRELVIDFPFSVFGLNRSPKRADLIAVLVPAVKAGIAAGWRPDSRGRTFRFKEIDE
jgi:hypothetical protein